MSASAMPTPVSRLPKFGSWSKSSSPTPAATPSHTFPTTRIPNGFYHHPGPAGGNGTTIGQAPSTRRIGSFRTPGKYSSKLRKDDEVTDGDEQVDHNDSSHRDTHLKSAADTSLPAHKNALSGPKTGLPVPKNRLPVSKSKLTGSKQNLNGLSGSKLRPPQQSIHSVAASSCCTGSGFDSSPPAARSRSTGNLGSAQHSRLTKSNGLRSCGLAVRGSASPNTYASSPLLNTKLNLKQSSTSGIQARTVKKSLLPAPKTNGVSYKLSRPSVAKQTRTIGVDVSQAILKTTVETPISTGSSPERTPDAPQSKKPPSQGERSIPVESLEDMSLSSGSSLDHDRTSQEYMDDFDNLGNGGVGTLLLAKNDEDDSGLDRSCAAFCDREVAGNGVAVETELHFLDDTLDWTHGTITGDDGQNHLTQFSHHSRSSPSDYHEQGGSSLDLSPSDSYGSGGIYMWDEEGLEPLGGAGSQQAGECGLTPHVGSFDSDVNSSDALTNVDSCDLNDDDLMLDGDFPDDISTHTDGDGTSHMAEWRRRQLCWGTQDVHSDDREAGYCVGMDRELTLDLSPHRTTDAKVDDLAEDFGALRSQLELLRRCLLQDDDTDDDTLTTDTLSPEDGDQSQVEALLQEVQQLKEDLRNKDQIISQLTVQLAVAPATSRCRCSTDRTEKTERHTQTSAVAAGESVASQTPWRDRTTFPPSAFLSPPWQYQRSRPYGGRPKPSIPSHLARKTTGISSLPPGRPEPTSRPPSKQKLRLPPSSAHPAPP
ncbi:serine-rich coiled-coil domain-containing protein 2-like isoform X1 [Corythoichthys intestinalis]|uniref:serine-rich coiled-coil domain-containing protein 2-like isoform X1 n=1 Tax=Corythoichthys intestinalis TaxID=161448 RepID=UPI0025A4D8B0|nr:serine-rich coiled-coil domain-containing protein 2-like isoform X1 [Corythoichthys intestinalis]XP_057682826.1 serine-rich coiled-coil domain-containing protein 2-like isoform X1 [Corythoichthys intestinalis]